ncbi:MAG: 1-acyl-sn-glycerol-3-phosphate acyltransferase [Verrucomicrobia bacterium]|nr:1-acyl-sn-glycerol-3-phosphate acyltransferase [Verrucomicrobiota bacterium]
MSGLRRYPFRVGFRCLQLCGALGVAALDYFFLIWVRNRSALLHERTAWLGRSSARILRGLNVTVTYAGEPPAEGMLVCNHLSYLDIMVLGQRQPVVFVSKADVRQWPIIGPLTACAGTLFLRREQRSDVARVAEAFVPLIAQGAVVAIFPEGTSSDGRQVLPFRSSLLEPAAANGWRVSPARISYVIEDGSVEEEVCYWGDMTFGPHLLNLFSKKRIRAFVAYGEALAPVGVGRKELAGELHRRVCALASEHGCPSASGPRANSSAGTEPLSLRTDTR